jgi:O-antigen ligase
MEVVRQHFLQFRPDSPSHFVGHAHNLYLDTATSSGVIGLVALLVWIAALTAVVLQGRRAPHHSFATPIGLLCALVVFLLNGLTQVNLWEGKVFHQVAWIAGWALSWPLAKKR